MGGPDQAVPAGPRDRTAEDRRGHRAARGREQGDRVALHRESAARSPDVPGRIVNHQSADRRADQASRSDGMTDQPPTESPQTPPAAPAARPALRASVAAGLGVLFILAAVGIGLASGRIARPLPSPVRVSITFTPAPTPSPTPYDEAAVFRGQPISGGCGTTAGVWLVTNGGGLLRYDGALWARVDSTLRSLTRVACGADAAYGIGFLGAVLVADEQTRQIRSTDVTIEDLWGVAALPNGALMVGTRGSVFILDSGDIQPFAKGIDEDLFGVAAFSLQSAWAVGDRGITYRLDQRGWNPIGSGQTNTVRAVAATTPANALAARGAGTIVQFARRRHAAESRLGGPLD